MGVAWQHLPQSAADEVFVLASRNLPTASVLESPFSWCCLQLPNSGLCCTSDAAYKAAFGVDSLFAFFSVDTGFAAKTPGTLCRHCIQLCASAAEQLISAMF